MSLELTIRPFRPDDLPRLKEITVAAFDGVSIDQGIERLFGEINGHDWQWRKGRHLDDDARNDAEGIFVLEIDGRVAGCITTRIDREAGIGLIPNLAITEEHRGQGHGRRMLEYALSHFRNAGLSHARIETLVQNEVGGHLYRSLGFTEVARQVHFCRQLEESRDEQKGTKEEGEGKWR